MDALTTLLQSCGLVQSQESRSQSRRRSFSDGIKVRSAPSNPTSLHPRYPSLSCLNRPPSQQFDSRRGA